MEPVASTSRVLPAAPAPTLAPMNDADFDAFVGSVIPAYAADKVASGQWTEDESLERSRRTLAELLPLGRRTPDNALFNVLDEHGRPVGTLWLAEHEQAGQRIAYVCDLWIQPESRRMGHARRALAAAEAEARRLGLHGVGLHVFGHNVAARALYETLGYRATNVNMFKAL